MSKQTVLSVAQMKELAGALLEGIPTDLHPNVAQHWIGHKGELHEGLKALLCREIRGTDNTYPLTVNYDTPVGDGVKAGQYGWSDPNIISQHFPSKREGIQKVEVELIHFNRFISTDRALEGLDKLGVRPAELHELLALGEKYPELQSKFPIVALGSVWQDPRGYRYVPYLYCYGSRRKLCLYWIEDDWDGYWRFAVVRK